MSATSNDRIHLEANFEEYITRKLAMLEGDGWRVSNNDTGFDPNTALYMPDFIEYLSVTAPDMLDKITAMRKTGEASYSVELGSCGTKIEFVRGC